MGKLIMWNLLSLDGFFEGTRNWDLDWHQVALDDNFFRFALEQLRSADTLVFGRVTYEGMARHWPTAKGEIAEFMNKLPKLVFSRSLERAEWANTRLVQDDAVATVRELKRQCVKNILVFGSADLSSTLIDAGLFDEYRLGITSVVLGRGRPLFREAMNQQKLSLQDARQLSPGCVVLRYTPAAGN